MDKLTVEEVEAELRQAHEWDGATQILQQLADIMRENERLRSALESIRTSKHPMAIEIEHMCEEALRNKDSDNG